MRQSNYFIFFIFLFSNFLFSQSEKEQEIEGITIKSVKKYKKKKDNPAYAIMQEVWKKKKSNGLLLHKDYQYKTYEKISFSIDNIETNPTKKKGLKELGQILDKYKDSGQSNGKSMLPILITENIYKTYGKNNPKNERKDLVATKVSGFEDNQILSKRLENYFKEINIYDNTINYLNIGFTSPVSRDGFSVFDYNIVDTISINTQPCYEIRFTPKNPDVLAFKGFLYISKDNYNVMKVDMQTNKNININFIKDIYTTLEFDNPDDETFIPIRNETTLVITINNKQDSKNIIASKTSVYSDYNFDNNTFTNEFLNEIYIPEDGLVKKTDEYWLENRTEILTNKEIGIYNMYDELKDTKQFKAIQNGIEALSSGFIPITKGLDYGDIFSTIGTNDIEGFRLRMGLRTYFGKNDMWRLQAYGAYGFKDNQFKYGAEGKYMFNKTNRFTIGAGARRDILQLGSQLVADEGIMSRSFASSSIIGRGENSSLSSVQQSNFFTSIQPWKNIEFRLDATQQYIKSGNPEKFNISYEDHGVLKQDLNDSRLGVSIIAKPNANYSTYGIERNEITDLTNNPTFILKYTRGFKDLLNADFNYNKLQFYYNQPFMLGSWGRLLTNVELGTNFEPLPLALQNVIPANQSYGIIKNIFTLMDYYEFVADNYAILHLEHHFNGKILSQIPLIKKLKLREIIMFRSAIGSLHQGSIDMNKGNINLKAPEKPYYEYGFGFENIGFGNFRIFRIDFNWRGNYLDDPKVSKSGIQFGFQLRF